LGANDLIIKLSDNRSDIILVVYLSRDRLHEADSVRNVTTKYMEKSLNIRIPINLKDFAIEIHKYRDLQEDYIITLNDWEEFCPSENLKPYYLTIELITIERNCLMVGK
jgi:hypothetical protein